MKLHGVVLVLAATAAVIHAISFPAMVPPSKHEMLEASLSAARTLEPERTGSVFLNELADDEVHDKTLVRGIPGFTDDRYTYSGLIDVSETKHTFYWFFEATKADPATAPTILWLQGGPGCSSMMGLFAEMGPISVTKAGEVVENPGYWNFANMLFIDNPVGAGLSYTSDPHGYVKNDAEASADVYKALTTFFLKYPKYAETPFFVAGESYSGHWTPAVSYKIYTENKGNPEVKINLQGFMVGDGLSDPEYQLNYHHFCYEMGICDQITRDKLAAAETKKQQQIRDGKMVDAFNSWDEILGLLMANAGGVNVYNILSFENYDFSQVGTWINSHKKLLHVDESVKYDECNGPAYQAVVPDFMNSQKAHIAEMLDNSEIRALIYCGQLDLIIESSTDMDWMETMEWKGQADWKAAGQKPWKTSDGVTAGYLKKVGNLAYTTVAGGGHLLPMDQPVRSREMAQRFCENKL